MAQFYEGLIYAGMGLLVVFAVLLILMVAILAMRLFVKEENATAAKEATPVAPVAASPASAAVDTNETIAVISATVAAMSGDDPNKRLRVKSIKDQNGNVIWSK